MKLLLVLSIVAFSGCASTTLYDRSSGKPIAKFQGDMSGSEYHDGDTSWKVAEVSHSVATDAGGRAFAKGTNSVGGVLVNGLMAAGSAGVVPKSAAVVLPVINSLDTQTKSVVPATYRAR